MGEFVGRADELRALKETIASSTPCAAIILGEPGTGKTRLLAEALARSRHPRVLRVHGYETEQPIALAAAAGLLRALGVLDSAPSGPLEAAQIFERSFRALRAAGAVLLVVDDIQWVDDVSLALCQYLVRGATESEHEVVVVAASRPSPRIATLTRALEDALPERVTTLELGPLTREDGVVLAQALDRRLDVESATNLWHRAAGSPFWLNALVRTGPGADADRFVTIRLRGASGDAAELLALLAIAARPLPASDVAELERWPVERVDRAGSELATRGVAVSGAATLRLTHDLIRDAAIADLPAETRIRLHRRLALWLEEHAADDPTLMREALEHRLAAGMPGADLALRVATGPRRRLLGDVGLRTLGEVAEREDSLDLLASLAALAAELGKHDIALERADRLADMAADPTDRARWLLLASRSAFQLGRVDESFDRLRRARERESGDAVLAVDLKAHEAAIVRWAKRDIAAARIPTEAVVGEARALVADRPEDPSARNALLRTLQGAFDAAFVDDEPTRALHIAQEMLDVTRTMSDEDQLRASLQTAIAFWARGDLRDSEASFRHVWSRANDRVFPTLVVETGYWFARVLRARGKLSEAASVAAETVALADRVTGLSSLILRRPRQVHALPHLVGISLGDWQRAIAGLERAATEEPDPHSRLAEHLAIAEWLARLDPDNSAARVTANVERALADGRTAGCRRCLGEVELIAAEALARVDRVQDAKTLLREFDGGTHEPTKTVGIWRTQAEAWIARAEGDLDRACLLLAAVEAHADEIGFEMGALWGKLDRGQTLISVDRAAATAALVDAAEHAARLDARTEALIADKALRSLGHRTWRRTTSEGLLTERERQIALLVAAGASNPEIAKRLFLSRKTVERHVSNVLRKVGARNRADLAARVSDLRVEGVTR